MAVNGRRFSADVLHEAIKAAKTGIGFIELLVKIPTTHKTVKLLLSRWEKYPQLVPGSSKPDLLSDIIKAH